MLVLRFTAVIGLGLLVGGCAGNPPGSSEGLLRPRLAVELPDEHHTPDGMVVDAKGNILVSIPNSNDRRHPAWIMRITPEDKLEKWFQPPVHPETKGVNPAGLAFGSDGCLYVADNQASVTADSANHKSRLLRVTVKDGKAVGCDVVAQGFVLANGVACHGEFVYVTETRFEPVAPKTGPLGSGVYRFKISEFKKDQPIQLKPGGADPHLAFKLTTLSEKARGGANGIAVAPDGTMYVCNFGDAGIIAVKFDAAGKVVSEKVVAQGGAMKCTDGIKLDASGRIYVADLLGNAIHRVDPKTGVVVTLAQNGNTTGKDGELDRPSEVCLRNGKLYISNIDLPREGNVFDKPHTISVIDLDGLKK